jgi:hypothetical protein
MTDSYTVELQHYTPQSYSSYNYHLYLNRLCNGIQSIYRDAIEETCRNGRIVTKVRDGRQLPAANSLAGTVAPFRFSAVNLNIPFAFCILTAIFVFGLMLVTFIGAATKGRNGKVVAYIFLSVNLSLSTR